MCQIFAGQDPASYECETRSLRLNGQSTSIRLEAAYWEMLDQIAEAEGFTTPGFHLETARGSAGACAARRGTSLRFCAVPACNT